MASGTWNVVPELANAFFFLFQSEKNIHMEWAIRHICTFPQGYVKPTFYHNIVWRDMDHVETDLIHQIYYSNRARGAKSGEHTRGLGVSPLCLLVEDKLYKDSRVIGVPTFPLKWKTTYCILQLPHEEGNTMSGRPLWDLEAAYSAPGNTAPTSILGNTEDCHHEVACGARKSSAAGPVVM